MLEGISNAPSPGAVVDVLQDIRMVWMRRWEWPRFRAVRYSDDFCFVNLELLPLVVVYAALSNGTEQILVDFCQIHTC